MFDLEKAIAEWRRQMLAAGIKTPVPLDELENHLREEIEQQIRSGASGHEVFQRTVLKIGQAKELNAEFAKAGNFLAFLGDDIFTIINRILGALWLVFCSWGFVVMSLHFISYLTSTIRAGQSLRLFGLSIELLHVSIYGAGILGSLLVIRGSKPGCWIVGIIAIRFTLLYLFILLRLTPTNQPFSVLDGSFTAFYAITALLMFLPSHSNVKPARQ